MPPKADAGALTLQQQAFRPRRLIEALADTLSARAETKGLTVEATIAADLPEMLIGDAARLRAAIENLIDNAVKFTERGAVRLDVRASQAGRGKTKLVCTVTDSGIGLTRAEIKRLFRPFTQANADIARRYGGAGLGLAVVKSLAKLMGGDLTVTSTPGRGSTFRLSIVLPIATADTSSSPHAQPTKTPARRLAVLCAEDNPYGRVILNTILTELGHRADFVGLGRGGGRSGQARLRRGADGRDAAGHRRPGSNPAHPRAGRASRAARRSSAFPDARKPATRRPHARPVWTLICASRSARAR